MIDFDNLNEKIWEAFSELCDDFGAEQIRHIEAVEWPWPRDTIRSTGERATSPRNIIDTGALRDSLSLERVSPVETVFHWDVDYAILVHQGAVLDSGTELPARPWIYRAMETYDLLENFQEKLEDKL